PGRLFTSLHPSPLHHSRLITSIKHCPSDSFLPPPSPTPLTSLLLLLLLLPLPPPTPLLPPPLTASPLPLPSAAIVRRSYQRTT
ncbi:unnamed protein product, partial [Closterium sp. NIES-54]